MGNHTMGENLPMKNNSQILIYQTERGQTKIEVLLENETVWLTQKLMAELFQTTKQNISLHIQNIYNDGELPPETTVKEYLTVQKITDIYVTSIDYDPRVEISIDFFKTVQNKLHWAITGKTAAEIIYLSADGSKPNMGLTSWRGDKVRKTDVTIAKNYLNEEELSALNNLVEQYLVFAEGQAMRRIPMHMIEWLEKLNGFLELNDRDILEHAGKISHDMAKELAESEYNKFNIERIRVNDEKESDFDKVVKQIETKAKHLSKNKGNNRKND